MLPACPEPIPNNAPEPCAESSIPADVFAICNGNVVMRVVVCGEKDFDQSILCAPDGTKVAVQTVWDHETNTNVTSYWDLVLGAVWVGDPATLTACPDVDTESDPQEMCDAGVSFIRWVVKSNGQPTGIFYDTDLNGAAYVPVGAVTFGACKTVEDVFVPHVNGCIERTVPGSTLICNSTTTPYSFSGTDLVVFTITANDGNGNYTMIQEQVPTAHAAFLALLQSIEAGNARAVEDIGPGFLLLNWHEGNITNVVDLSATEVQFDIHVEAGISDIPQPLIAPCVDPVANATYQSSATTLRTIYDPVPLNIKQANGGTAISFVVTNYFATLIPGGDDTVTHIPAKQVVKLVDGLLVETYHTPGDINTEIPFDNATDVFKNVCVEPVTTLALQSGSASIANGTIASTLGPDGTAWVAPTTLKSVTVRARRSNTNDATLAAPNRIVVTTAIGVTVLLTNETFTWSVEDANVLDFIQVETFGNSAAYIEWVQL